MAVYQSRRSGERRPFRVAVVWGFLGKSDLSVPQRVWNCVKRFPGDVLFERSEQAGTIVDIVQLAICPTVFGMGAGETLLTNWIVGEVPTVINIGRSLIHRNPDAPAGSWARDWTYFTRPRARQPEEIAG